MTFEQIFAVVRRALPFALVGAIALGVLGLAYSFMSPKLYQATARVIVEPRTRTLTSNQDVVSGLPQRDATVVDTEVEFLVSRSVAERVVRNVKLVSDPEFGDGTDRQTIDRFEGALQIKRVGMTYLIDIAVDSLDPKRAATLANATAAAYVELQKERKREATLAASQMMASRVKGMAEQLRVAEEAVQQYRISNNLMSVNGTTLAEQSAAQLSQQLATARAQERAAQGDLSASAGAGVSLDSANAQASLGALRAQQASAQQEMSAAAAKYGNKHPLYVAAAQRLDQIDKAVEAEADRARAAVSSVRQAEIAEKRARAAAASSLRQSLESSAGANAAGLTHNSRASTELADLERTATALRSTYETYLNRLRQTETQIGTEQSDSDLVSAAAVPGKPYKPNTKMNLIIGALAGFLCGVALATVLMLFESHFSTAAQIEEQLDLEALPSLPTVKSAELAPGELEDGSDAVSIARAMIGNSTGTFAEMHKNLLGALDRTVDGKPNQVIAITSSLPREGKTTTAICLSAIGPLLGRRVILVDCDQRRRGVTNSFDLQPSVGLADALADPTAANKAIVRDVLPGLDLLPATRLPGAKVDIFDPEKVAALIAELRKSYDLVLLDTAPILPIADTRALAPLADSVLFLCRWRKTPRRAVEHALDILGKTQSPIAGVALTLVNLTQQAKYGYGDTAFYYSQYKEYYHTPA